MPNSQTASGTGGDCGEDCRDGLHGQEETAEPGSEQHAASAAAMLATVASAVLRGSFRIRQVGLRSAVRRVGVGCLMGAGAAMIPGGNHGLILFGIPSLSPHALPALFGNVAGIWTALAVMRASGARIPKISCDGDICVAGPVTARTAGSPSVRTEGFGR